MSREIDVAVIGAGPAGLSAAIYLAREGLSVVVYERGGYGGLLPQIGDLQNYPGFLGAGKELATTMREQAEKFGAVFRYGECGGVNPLVIDGEEVRVRTVLVATGCEPKRLELPGVANERISYCATCDAPLYRGKSALVVGGGNSAVQEALHIAEFAEKVVIVNRSKLRASEDLVARVKASEKIEILAETDPVEYARKHKFDGYFVFIGMQPATGFLPKEMLDEGMVATDEGYMTSLAGVFAAGSVRKGAVNQVVTVAGEGAEAGMSVAKWLRNT